MALLGEGKPNVKALARNGDIDALIEAASYQDLTPSSSGTRDLGIPVRAEAILALGALDATRGKDAVAGALHDPADLVRCASIRVLHARREAELLAQSLRWLPADDGHSRKLAFQAVFDLRELVSAPKIAGALVHRDDEELLSEDEVRLILAVLEDDRAGERDELMQLLLSALGKERGIVVDRAGELLVRLAPAGTASVVRELSTGAAPAEAAYVLGRIGDPETMEALVKGLGHRDPRVRVESAAALAELQDPATVEPLLRATRDDDHGVRKQARLALDRLGNTAVIVGIAALLEPLIQEAVRSVARPGSRHHGANGGPESVAPTSETRGVAPGAGE